MKRILGIDFLRGISICYIVGFWHLLNYTRVFPNYNNVITYRLTWIVLGTFVLISGYFLGQQNIERNTLFAFYKKRLLRIYPPYLLAIIGFAILGLCDINTSVKAICGISMFIRPAPPTLWFITMLLFFYLMAPFFILISQHGILKYSLLYIFLLCCLLGYEYVSKIIFNYYYLDMRVAVYLSSFMTGIYLAKTKIHKYKYKLLLLLSIISFVISCYFNTENWDMNLLMSIPLVTVVPVLLILIFKNLKIRSNILQRITIFLSVASYFMYLFHRIFYKILTHIYYPNNSVAQLLYLFLICLPIITVSSFLMQESYNNILKSLTKRFT